MIFVGKFHRRSPPFVGQLLWTVAGNHQTLAPKRLGFVVIKRTIVKWGINKTVFNRTV
jgi:hypothetical protein